MFKGIQGTEKGRKTMEGMKAFVWNLISYDAEMIIRSVIEPGFREKHVMRARDGWRKLSGLEKPSKNGTRVIVVFFCHSPATWNSIKSIFQAALDDSDVEAHLIALPPKIFKENGDISHEIYGENEAYEYCVKFYPETINAFDESSQSWFDLKTLKPDYVVLSRPYDQEIQPKYHSAVLSTYTRICYVPYSYCKMKWDSRVVYKPDFIDQVYVVFTENQMYQRIVKRVFCGLFRMRWKQIRCEGYPRFDLYAKANAHTGRRSKTVLWLPRWTTKELLEATTFFRYKNLLIDYFKMRPQIRLICRPHPLMFENFVSTGEMTEADVDEFKRVFAETENFMLDESGDYIPAFMDADLFLADTSSLLIEEFITGKPVIFLGAMTHFDREAKKWAKMMYPVRDGKELIEKIEELLSGKDPKRTSRERFIETDLKTDGKSGRRIIDFIKADFVEKKREKGISI